tara:strand:- start:394 stop:582 length:189 start_codon:yes stop_codon:yes gene_type:complete
VTEGDWEGLIGDLTEVLASYLLVTDNIPHIEHVVERWVGSLKKRVLANNAKMLEERIQKYHS